jgi:hypothetical protein
MSIWGRARVRLHRLDETAEIQHLVVIRGAVPAVREHVRVVREVRLIGSRGRHGHRRARVVVLEAVVREGVHLLHRVAGVVLELEHHVEPVLGIDLVSVHKDDRRVVERAVPSQSAEAADRIAAETVLERREVGREVGGPADPGSCPWSAHRRCQLPGRWARRRPSPAREQAQTYPRRPDRRARAADGASAHEDRACAEILQLHWPRCPRSAKSAERSRRSAIAGAIRWWRRSDASTRICSGCASSSTARRGERTSARVASRAARFKKLCSNPATGKLV